MNSAPIRVLYLLHDSRRSGVPAVASAFIRRANEAGVQPTVLFAHDGIFAHELKQAGIPVITLGARTTLLWRVKHLLMNLFLVFSRNEFDLVHIHSTKLVWSVLTAKLLGLRTIFHLHELPRSIGPLLRRAIAAADEVVYCSKTCAEHYARLGIKRGVTVVNALAFSDDPPVEHTAGNRRIVMAASINRNKGQDLLLEAFARLPYPDAELYLYGTVGLSARGFVRALKERSVVLGISDRVHFPGPTTDVLSVFRSAAAVVHTSWTESFGMALVEAQSCGVPVIAHNLEGMREVVIDGETGYLVPPGDVSILAERLKLLLDHPELRNRLGRTAWRSVRERFDVSTRIRDYYGLYSKLLRSAAKGD